MLVKLQITKLNEYCELLLGHQYSETITEEVADKIIEAFKLKKSDQDSIRNFVVYK